MLTVTRHAGQSIQIGAQIIVTIARIGVGKVRIGIAAPRDVNIFRTELRTSRATPHVRVGT